MVVDGNQIREIFLGQDRERISQGLKKTGLGSQQGFWNDIFGGSFDSYVDVDSIEYSPDRKKCIVKKGNNEYVVTQGKLAFKQDLGVNSHKDRYNFTQIAVDENGYTQCRIEGTKHSCSSRTSRFTDKGKMSMLVEAITTSEDWFEKLNLTDLNGADEYIRYLQDEVLEDKFKIYAEEDDINKEMLYDIDINYDKTSSSLPLDRGKRIRDSWKEDFLEAFEPMLADPAFKSIIDALNTVRSEKIDFIRDAIKKSRTATQSSNAGLGDNWARLTSDHRVDKSLKR